MENKTEDEYGYSVAEKQNSTASIPERAERAERAEEWAEASMHMQALSHAVRCS